MLIHDFTVRLQVTACDGITREDIERDLPLQLMVQEQKPYRGTEGAGWWTNSHAAVMIEGASAAERTYCTGCGSYHDPADCGYNPASPLYAI